MNSGNVTRPGRGVKGADGVDIKMAQWITMVPVGSGVAAEKAQGGPASGTMQAEDLVASASPSVRVEGGYFDP